MPRTASTASMGSANTKKDDDDDELPLLSPKPTTTTTATPSSLVTVARPGGKEEEAQQPPQVSSRRIWGLSRPEAKWVALAVGMAVVNGCTFPAVRFLGVLCVCVRVLFFVEFGGGCV